MKILFVADVSIEADVSGAERVLFEQATGLAARGHHVDILTRRLPEHISDHADIQGVREWRYAVNPKNNLSSLVSTLKNGKDLFEHLNRTNRYDCINFHQPFSAFAVLRSRQSKPVRKIYTCHSFSFEEHFSRYGHLNALRARITGRIQRLMRKRIEKSGLTESDHIVVLSRFTQDKLLDVYRVPVSKITVIPGGVDLNRFQPVKDKHGVRARLGLPAEKTILLTVRGLEPRMGIENLIRAMADIVPSFPDIFLVVGGNGPLKESLAILTRQLGLEQYVQFTGFISEEVLPLYYQAADLFVLPTVELEGFGLVTLEALASGTPVLGTPIGGTPEILKGLDARFLFKDASSESIAAGIIQIGREYRYQKDKRQSDSSRCRQYVEKNYSWQKNIDATERLFSAI